MRTVKGKPFFKLVKNAMALTKAEKEIVMSVSQLMTVGDVKKMAAGESFKVIAVVSTIFKKIDKNGKPYYDASVMDSSGSADAKIWSDAVWCDRSDGLGPEVKVAAKKLEEDDIQSLMGRSVGIDGRTAEYRGQLQLNFNKLTLLDQDKFPPAEYLPRSPFPIESLTERFDGFVNECRPEVASFLKAVFSGTLWTSFRDWPAAVSHHHAYANGLLEHTLSVTDCAKSSAESFIRAGYEIDVDIVIAGALLHDLGKLEAYSMSAVPEITLEGAVLDHVALGYSRFTKIAEETGLDSDLRLQLAHILLSHHGLREYGSPVVPATPEALIVSAADELDFKVFCWRDSIKDLAEGQHISQWHAATGRRFWDKKG
jgi:3'-5' exoribonuclease